MQKLQIGLYLIQRKNSLFLDLKPYAFLLKAVAPALSVPQVSNLSRKEGAVNKVVQQIEPLPLNSVRVPLDDGGFWLTLLPIPFPSSILLITERFMES